jgi:hypothetical protein
MYDDVNTPRWNFEIKPFVTWWVVQMEEDMPKLGVVEDHVSFWDATEKGRCCYWLTLELKKGRDIDQP